MQGQGYNRLAAITFKEQQLRTVEPAVQGAEVTASLYLNLADAAAELEINVAAISAPDGTRKGDARTGQTELAQETYGLALDARSLSCRCATAHQ
jgi:hypothetical protein